MDVNDNIIIGANGGSARHDGNVGGIVVAGGGDPDGEDGAPALDCDEIDLWTRGGDAFPIPPGGANVHGHAVVVVVVVIVVVALAARTRCSRQRQHVRATKHLPPPDDSLMAPPSHVDAEDDRPWRGDGTTAVARLGKFPEGA